MNHDLDPMDPAGAPNVATYTQQLLVLGYERGVIQGDAEPST